MNKTRAMLLLLAFVTVSAARAYALMSVTGYDGIIACWDGKYTYWAARPNMLDPSIVTLFPNPNHPTYPSAHAMFDGPYAAVLGYLFPRDADYFAAQAQEAGLSRLWAGIHFRSDIEAGLEIGRAVAQKVIERAHYNVCPPFYTGAGRPAAQQREAAPAHQWRSTAEIEGYAPVSSLHTLGRPREPRITSSSLREKKTMPDFRLRIGILFTSQDRILTIDQTLPDGRLGLKDLLSRGSSAISTMPVCNWASGSSTRRRIVPGTKALWNDGSALKIGNSGIQLFSLHYNSPALSLIRRRMKGKQEAQVKYDPTDLSMLHVLDPERGQYFPVPPLEAQYT